MQARNFSSILGRRHESAQIVRLAKLRRCSRSQQFELQLDFQGARRRRSTEKVYFANLRTKSDNSTESTLERRPDALCPAFPDRIAVELRLAQGPDREDTFIASSLSTLRCFLIPCPIAGPKLEIGSGFL